MQKGKDEDFHKKVDENLKAAEERTSKKRAKRLKKKQNAKKKNTGIKAKSSSGKFLIQLNNILVLLQT